MPHFIQCRAFSIKPGRLSKAHKEKEKEKEQQRQEEKERRSNGDKVKHKSSERDGGKDERKRKHRESSQDRYISSKDEDPVCFSCFLLTGILKLYFINFNTLEYFSFSFIG